MSVHLGTRITGSTVYRGFTTHAVEDGANIAPLSAFEAADLRIYKNGSDVQRTSANGITMTSPFDSITGGHVIAIDLSDNTHSGFYAAGSYYEVWLVPDETIDGVAVNALLFSFDIADSVPTVQDVIDGLWDALTSAHGDTGSFGKAVADILLAAATTIPSRLPAALSADGHIMADVKAVDGSETAAQNQQMWLDLEEFMPVDAHRQNFDTVTTPGFVITKKPDGTTDTAYSPKTLTTDPAAEPITGSS